MGNWEYYMYLVDQYLLLWCMEVTQLRCTQGYPKGDEIPYTSLQLLNSSLVQAHIVKCAVHTERVHLVIMVIDNSYNCNW